eukprot:335711-Rhodomonas_salina.2
MATLVKKGVNLINDVPPDLPVVQVRARNQMHFTAVSVQSVLGMHLIPQSQHSVYQRICLRRGCYLPTPPLGHIPY